MKMHGLGNDFVILDARTQEIDVSQELIASLADRHRGIGFDQLAVIRTAGSDVRLVFYNSDGSASAACGNATRCIAHHLMQESGETSIKLLTDRGVLEAALHPNGLTTVNMGPPQLKWWEIPLASEMQTLHLPIDGDPTATGMGNPHMTFFVPSVAEIDLERFGSAHENHPLYPERTNVQIAQIIAPDVIRMRVWERGAGITLASGSSSCAVAVAAARNGLTGKHVQIVLDGGEIEVEWREDGVWMTGPTAHVFSGRLARDFMESFS
ncbi:MAG: diaminopimelate epimerase [Roseobacter sp.]